MTDGAADQTPVARQEVFEEYKDYYRQMCVDGSPRVCDETLVTEKAVRFLLSESDTEGRFKTIDFYKIAFECVEISVNDCRSVFAALIKATGVLEVLCVNLFLYPWKKEIKSLKTYTGAFVYCVQSVLPMSTTQSILASVGYQPHSDRLYLLAGTADPETAIGVGFDLFLARKECEHLLQVMGQGSQPECLEILQRRATPPGHSNPGEESAAGSPGQEGEVEKEEEGLSAGCSLVVPGSEETVEDQVSSKSTGPAEPLLSSGLRPSSPLNEDRSILEMQRNYPDLAIRKKPIFIKPLMRPPAARSPRQKAGLSRASCTGGQQLNGPQLPSIHTTADTRPPQHTGNCQARPAPPEDSGNREEEGPERQAQDGPEVGAEAGGQLYLHEEKLRYPVEETGSHDSETTSDLRSDWDRAPPILCHPSLVPICSIPGCHSCGEDGNNLREPPHSVYIPASPLELCEPSQATEGDSTELQSQATEGDSMELQSQAMEGFSMELQSLPKGAGRVELQSQAMGGPREQQCLNPTQKPEDELVHTYVMVENDRK